MPKYEIGIQNQEFGFMIVDTDLDPASSEFNDLVQEKFENGDFTINKNYIEWEVNGIEGAEKKDDLDEIPF